MLALVIPSLNHEMFVTANIGAALGLFLAGGWLTGQLSHIIHPRRRIWLVLCNFLQTCLVFAAAALQYAYGDVALQSTAESNNAVTLVTIGLLAFASGSQVVQSRSLGVTEISTAMATAAWIDLLIDPGLFALRNRPRTRRLTFLLTLAIGSLIGAEIYKRAGSATAIAVSGVGKLIVTFMYLFNKAEPPKEALAPPSPV
ncbi:hypothetical protein VTK73DRAFT_3220 [Phialemonium thermophilum]|uniref:DUF1275 domain protein n=1 Tax=Phialemonium thermophilum TaxID=223376 RepID=A0ABR3Y7F2_9PEZI